MKYLSARTATSWVVSCLLMLAAASCSGTDGNSGNGSDNGEEHNGKLEPLELTSEKLGVGIRHGGAAAIEGAAEIGPDALKETFSTAFLHLQVYDEHAWLLGEWMVRGGGDSSYKRSDQYRDDADAESWKGRDGSFGIRTNDLVEEVEGVFEDGFSNTGIVLDFWRTRGDWYVRWDGNLAPEANRKGKGSYGFADSEMVNSVDQQLRAIASTHTPRYMVIGEDMGRLLARKGKPGLSPSEFANFRTFYRDVAVDIREKSSKTRVGAGFHWDHFVKYVAPMYGPEEKGTVPSDETLARAFEAVILPFAQVGKMIALKSYRKPSKDVEYYQFLASIDERFDLEGVKLVWYSIGSPVGWNDSRLPQANYFRDFLEWNAGVKPDVVAWRALRDINGANKANDELLPPCKTLRDDPWFNMSTARCVDGLLDTTNRRKPVFEAIESELN